MRLFLAATLSLAGACSAASETSADIADTSGGSQVIESKSGTYQIVANPKIDPSSLPSNADIKMLDGDPAKYAIQLCGLDFADEKPTQRCEVFVQRDPSGHLIGYIALRQSDVVSIETALKTIEQNGGQGCAIFGNIESSNFEDGDRTLDASRDFQGRLPFFAWEKSPGNWMISTEGDDPNSAGGMWYFERKDNKLRVSQERWNYCYKDSGIYIDEVFEHLASLSRASP